MNRLETRLKVIPEGFLRDFGGVGGDFQCAAEAVLHIALSALWRANRFASGCRAAGLCPQERNRDIMRKKLLSRMRGRGETGFTLIEVVVAVVLLLIIGLSAGNFAIQAVKASRDAQQRAIAVSIAQEHIEKLSVQIINQDKYEKTDETSKRSETLFNALTKGISKTDSENAEKALKGYGVDYDKLVSGLTSYNESPDSSAVKAIDESYERSSTQYTAYTIISKCAVLSGDSDCKKVTGTSYSYDDGTSADSDLSSQKTYVKGRFTDGTDYYGPMLRATVVVVWKNFSWGSDIKSVYSVSKVFDVNQDKRF